MLNGNRYWPVAQLAERPPVKRNVVGPSPTWPAGIGSIIGIMPQSVTLVYADSSSVRYPKEEK